MPQAPREDLFESSKMTFGEHLDELRSSLIKALLSLLVGFLIGLLFAPQVVKLLQSPVNRALVEYYTVPAFWEMVQDRHERGEALPKSWEALLDMGSDERKGAILDLLDEKPMLPELFYYEPAQALYQLREEFPGAFEGVEIPEEMNNRRVPLYLYKPLDESEETRLRTFNAQEGFMVYIKAALLFGAVVSCPPVFWFLWSFVAAGLYPHEKRYVYVFGPFSLALFVAGAALAFFGVFYYVLDFLFSFNRLLGINPEPRINEWLGFALMLPLGFGISFQLPLVMLFLERIGVFTVEAYLAKWRIAVLIIFVLSMLLTPADPMSMILMAIPLTVLFFGGILLCRFMPRRKTPFGETIG